MRLRLPLLSAALLVGATVGLRAQTTATVSDLAQLLALEDRREFDGGALRRAAQHPDPLVRRWSARAVGAIGDRSGTPLMLELLADPALRRRYDATLPPDGMERSAWDEFWDKGLVGLFLDRYYPRR